MRTELIHVGLDGCVAPNRALAVSSPGLAPARRTMSRGKERSRAVDLASDRRTKAVLVPDDDWPAPIAPETIAGIVASAREPGVAG